jgi:hypothetical protein
MKNIILTIISNLIFLGSYAQSQFSAPTVSVAGKIYNCDNSLGQYVRIVNQKNQVSDGADATPYKQGCTLVDLQSGEFNLILNAFKNSFTSSRWLTLAQKDKYCVINFYFI